MATKRIYSFSLRRCEGTYMQGQPVSSHKVTCPICGKIFPIPEDYTGVTAGIQPHAPSREWVNKQLGIAGLPSTINQ